MIDLGVAVSQHASRVLNGMDSAAEKIAYALKLNDKWRLARYQACHLRWITSKNPAQCAAGAFSHFRVYPRSTSIGRTAMPNVGSSSQVKTYSLAHPIAGTTGTGLDQFVEFIYADNGLAGATDGRDIAKGASYADRLNQRILEAANATGAAADGKFYGGGSGGDEPVHSRQSSGRMDRLCMAMTKGARKPASIWCRTTVRPRSTGVNNLVNTVADGVYHLGFEIQGNNFLNEDGDANATLQQMAEWLTQFYTDHSTTNTGLDRVTNLIMADKGLDCRIPDS
jgi:hypothetical protein